jgi:hypothetical protein
MFTGGQIIFMLAFLAVFIAALAWSYRKDSVITKTHFKKAYLILFSIIIFLTILFVIVKIRKFL